MKRDQVETLRFRFCPFCSSDQFVFDGIKSYLCASCKRKYFINESAAVAAIIFDENLGLMLVTRGRDPKKGMLDLPGGFIDLGETAEDALKREIFEELGADVEEAEYFSSEPNTYEYDGFLYYTLDMAFFCKLKDYSSLLPSDDISAYTFISPDKIDIDKIAFDSIKRIIQKFLNKLSVCQ